MTLTPEWQQVSKRWGHSFHPMCSYMAMFPARLPHYFIEKFTRPGDVVLDPFSGRGTTPLQACIDGRIGIGNDKNPLAYYLTKAKVQAPLLKDIEQRLRQLESDLFYDDGSSEHPNIQMLFHPYTLGQLVYLRSRLDDDRPTDVFIKATILGIMHGASNKDQTGSSFLSISMPNTFSMSPNYVRKYIKEKGLKQIRVNVFEALRRKIKRLFKDGRPAQQGFAHLGDVAQLHQQRNSHLRRRVKLIVTSPPYLHVIRYGLYNWIRLWFLAVDGPALDGQLATHPKLPHYLEFICGALNELYKMLAPGGVVALVVGDVTTRGRNAHTINLAEEIWGNLEYEKSPFLRYDLIEDHIEDNTKVTKIWDKGKGRATQTDRILVLYKKHIEELTDQVTW